MRDRKTSRRFLVYMDPRICPTCGAPATEVFGARRYCGDDAAAMASFLLRQGAAPVEVAS